MASVRPFQFTGLPALSGAQVAVHESLARHLTRRPLTAEFAASLAKVLEHHLKLPCRILGPDLRAVPRTGLSALVGQAPCVAVLATAPGDAKVLVDLDPALAALAIDRLLGGKGDEVRPQRPFTDIETGVLSYVILKVLDHVQSGLETGRELAVGLHSFIDDEAALAVLVEAEAGYQELTFRLATGKRLSRVRILIPDSLVHGRFGAPVPQSGATDDEIGHMRRMLAALGEVPVTARLTVSKLDLEPDDILHVEPGDIILLEDHKLTITPDGIAGEVFVTVGDGNNGGFQGRVYNNVSDASQAWLEVLTIVRQEHPLEAPMGADDPQSGDAVDNLPATEGLLRDVKAPVVVELGRIGMNTAQVARLRTGQVLRLTRGPHDPVDLVVHGKLLARGELIEVDGELGVRLTQVTAAE